MITEGFEVAIRLGVLDDSGLVVRRIAERKPRYAFCGSAYVRTCVGGSPTWRVKATLNVLAKL